MTWTILNRSAAVALLSFCLTAGVWAQPKKVGPSSPPEKPRKVKPEPNDAHKRWITEDVPYIITPAERLAWDKLKTNEERENFIAEFWRRRDPDPDTEENEYREQYYERIAYANEHFSSGILGWKTDRGRIYIAHGKPDSVESHPSGGAYDRPSYEGDGSITTYPFETWFYRHLDGVGDGVEIEFVDRTGSGEYKIARDLDEKNALATVASRVTRTGSTGFTREQDSPLARNLLISNLETPPAVRFSDLLKVVNGDSGSIDTNPISFDVRVDFFRLSDDRVVTAFTVQTRNGDLQFKDAGGIEAATVNILGRITAVAGDRSGIFEEAVTTRATAAELADTKANSSIYQKAIALTPGTYKVDVVVRDVNTGNRGVVSLGFAVPRYDDKKLSTSSLVLASKLRPTTERDLGQRFVIGNAKVVPNVSGVYKRGEPVGVYMQVYNAGTDQTTLRPAVDVDYVVTSNGAEVFRKTEDWTGLSDSGPRLTIARLLATDTLPAGNYELKVILTDRVGGQKIENSGRFSIEK